MLSHYGDVEGIAYKLGRSVPTAVKRKQKAWRHRRCAGSEAKLSARSAFRRYRLQERKGSPRSLCIRVSLGSAKYRQCPQFIPWLSHSSDPVLIHLPLSTLGKALPTLFIVPTRNIALEGMALPQFLDL